MSILLQGNALWLAAPAQEVTQSTWLCVTHVNIAWEVMSFLGIVFFWPEVVVMADTDLVCLEFSFSGDISVLFQKHLWQVFKLSYQGFYFLCHFWKRNWFHLTKSTGVVWRWQQASHEKIIQPARVNRDLKLPWKRRRNIRPLWLWFNLFNLPFYDPMILFLWPSEFPEPGE